MTKFCSKCKEKKAISEFSKNRSRKDGLGNWCKRCMKIYSKKYRMENRKYFKNYHEEYRQKNKEKIREYYRKYYQKRKRMKKLEILILKLWGLYTYIEYLVSFKWYLRYIFKKKMSFRKMNRFEKWIYYRYIAKKFSEFCYREYIKEKNETARDRF